MDTDLRVYEYRLKSNPKFLCSFVGGDFGGDFDCEYDPDYVVPEPISEETPPKE